MYKKWCKHITHYADRIWIFEGEKFRPFVPREIGYRKRALMYADTFKFCPICQTPKPKEE